MSTMKKLLSCTLVVAIIVSVAAFAAAPSDESAIAKKALAEVTSLYEGVYTISNAATEVTGMTYDDMGNAVVNVIVSFDRTLKAASAEDMPYIQGLERASVKLTDQSEISAANAYIQARKADLEGNYIGVPQDTYIELQVTVPAATTLSKASQRIGIGDIKYVGMFENVPAENLAPASKQSMIESGQDAIQTIAANATALSAKAVTINDEIKKYNRVRARDYARSWSCTGGYLYDHSSCHNPDYSFFDSEDCTNFVSQCFVYAGLKTNDTWKPYTGPWNTTGNDGNGIRQYVTNNGLFFRSTAEKKAFAGSIINWLNSNGTNAGHVGLVDQNDTVTMTFCAHTRCRKSCPWAGEKVDFYIPYWDSYANDWTPQ